ncbi:MAG TPA: ABC transporter permease [Bryobacteraceae bacterium]|nr:ABC transporter permease [Bryobacteraceae bacterium]
MVTILRDLRYSLRTFQKSPLFTSVALLSLALGIGANVAIFTLVNQLILQMLPVNHPEQLVLLTARGHHYGSNNGSNALSYPMYQDFRDKNRVFSGMFCRHGETFSLSFEGKTELVSGELVSGNYFPVLGVGAALGRVFSASDDLMQGGHPLAVLSYAYWKTRFAGDRTVTGKKIVVNGYPLTIIGVSQAGFDGVQPGYSPQIRVPITMQDDLPKTPFPQLNDRRRRFVQAFGRLKPGMTLEHAKAGLQPLFHQILQMEVVMPAFTKTTEYTRHEFLAMWMDVLPGSKGRSELRRQFANPLLALMAIVALVLLIACSNLANLLIARASARQKEIAVRLALGAGRRRLVGQLLVESLALSMAGGAAGLGLAVLLDKTLLGFLPPNVAPLTLSSSPDASVMGFAFLLSVLTGVIFGLVPALQATRPQLASTLKDQAGAVVGGTSVLLRKCLVVAQVGLSLLLLIGAGLFIQSLRNLEDLKPGFDTANVVTFAVEPTLGGYRRDWTLEYYRRLTERVQALPGVTSMALVVIPLLADNEWDNWVTVEGYTAKQGEMVDPYMQFCSTGYFDTMKIPILLGRDFTLKDDAGAPKVGIVNQKFARRYFGAANPIGRHVGFGRNPGTKLDIQIVGVAGDTKYTNMRDEMPYELYVPYGQAAFVDGMAAYVRTRGNPEGLFSVLRQVVPEVDPTVPMYEMRTLDKQAENSLVTERLLATLSGGFGLVATLLAAMGLYGVMAYMVARRTREIGIRMALGANSGSVVWMVMREVLLLAAAGVAIGLPAAWALTRLVQAQLFGMQARDSMTMLLATAGIATVALLSGYLPARRATGIDPMRALHWE